ncbi:MAG TPA: hypothetical protein P5280_06425 [Cyclobacteriaceae bacterium]|nr:hypothetical protein [Cyclobacteriaceae bacterium]
METRNIEFENVWRKGVGELRKEIITIWKQYNPGLEEEKANERIGQLVFLIKNNMGQVVGISTAYKAYIKQLKNYFYAIRLTILPRYRGPGMASALIVKTRDFLEAIHKQDGPERIIGMITLVENEEFKVARREAIWKASQMVYIGNSSKGHHIRVYYFKGATVI